MKHIIQRTILPLLFLIASCSSNNKEIDACPLIVVNKSVIKASYYNNNDENLKNKIMDVFINDSYYDCWFKNDKIKIKIAPEFKIIKGMAFDKGSNFEYFVAVLNKGKVLSKQIFKIDVNEINEIGFLILKDKKEVNVNINSNNPEDYVIYIGLQLNEKQLKDNRSNKLWLN